VSEALNRKNIGIQISTQTWCLSNDHKFFRFAPVCVLRNNYKILVKKCGPRAASQAASQAAAPDRAALYKVTGSLGQDGLK
jgi:hypothetical protein